MSAREEILSLLHRGHPASPPVFSGLAQVLRAGLERESLSFPEVHSHPDRLARAAAATFHLTGIPSAALPFDLCVEAEALGSVVDFRAPSPLEFPRISAPLLHSRDSLLEEIQIPEDVRPLGRVQTVCDALKHLRHDVGEEVVLSGVLAGPFTVLGMLMEPGLLFHFMKQTPESVLALLLRLASFIARIGICYHESGADFLTVHEMGGSPDVLGAKRFEYFVVPSLKCITAALPAPRVLAVCGNLEKSAPLLESTGADALSLDQSNDLRSLRMALPHSLLFGNIDPVGALALGDTEKVRASARKAVALGVDAVWPGCDLLPDTPPENFQALLG